MILNHTIYVLTVAWLESIVQLKGLSDLRPEVKVRVNPFEIVQEMDHLPVFLLIEEWKHGDAIVNLKSEGVTCIVNKDYILHVSACCKDPQVFDMNSVSSRKARVSVEPGVKKRVVWINIVQDCVCIVWMRSSEHDDLPIFLQLSDYFMHVWTNINPKNGLVEVSAFVIWDLEHNISLRNVVGPRIADTDAGQTMDQSLVHVKDQQLLG